MVHLILIAVVPLVLHEGLVREVVRGVGHGGVVLVVLVFL